MKTILGILCVVLALYMFFIAATQTGPVDSAYSFGFFVGSHLPWVLIAYLAYYLLKKK